VRHRFWADDGLNGFADADFPGEIWHPTFDRPGPRGLLQLFPELAPARILERLPNSERVAAAAEMVDRVSPGLRERLEGGVSKCWAEDPWARGAIVLPGPGQMTQLFPHTATPEGRVHFAGEHTSMFMGWMEGALRSGIRAAQEVNEAD
jgi:monoamine oxidase